MLLLLLLLLAANSMEQLKSISIGWGHRMGRKLNLTHARHGRRPPLWSFVHGSRSAPIGGSICFYFRSLSLLSSYVKGRQQQNLITNRSNMELMGTNLCHPRTAQLAELEADFSEGGT
uniref:Putative secreted peptide n=1 Tax=Anopheles braziliensis TaxID=58242 RepID=A0A2M3ZQL0_9DIPT